MYAVVSGIVLFTASPAQAHEPPVPGLSGGLAVLPPALPDHRIDDPRLQEEPIDTSK
jgi:hypothetical protein